MAGQTLRWRGCSPSSDVSTFNPPPPSHPPPKYHPVDRRPFHSNTSLALTRVSTILKSSNIFHMWSLVETLLLISSQLSFIKFQPVIYEDVNPPLPLGKPAELPTINKRPLSLKPSSPTVSLPTQATEHHLASLGYEQQCAPINCDTSLILSLETNKAR